MPNTFSTPGISAAVNFMYFGSWSSSSWSRRVIGSGIRGYAATGRAGRRVRLLFFRDGAVAADAAHLGRYLADQGRFGIHPCLHHDEVDL